MAVNQDEWQTVWNSVLDLSENFADFVLIGGVAVYVHLVNRHPDADFAIEFSHDIDAYVSLADFADMRDIYVVTPNKRLNKQQVNIGTTEVDLYIEHNHRLAVPYGELSAHRVTYDQLKVSALEHLLILKIDAAQDRWGTEKGEKDARDIARIIWVAGRGFDYSLTAPYLNDDRRALLADVWRRDPFLRLARGNTHLARPIREAYDHLMQQLGLRPKTALDKKKTIRCSTDGPQ